MNSSGWVRGDASEIPHVASEIPHVVNRRSGQVRLCCALTEVRRAIISQIPATYTKFGISENLCDSSTFRTGGSVWCSDGGAS
jgi:hypothetical protein